MNEPAQTVNLGTYETEQVLVDVKDWATGKVLVKKGSWAIILGDDEGDNSCTLHAKTGQYLPRQKYHLLAVPETKDTAS